MWRPRRINFRSFSTLQVSESLADYVCRIESVLQSVIDKGDIPFAARDQLFKHRLWVGLSSSALKAQTRYQYESILDYNTLLRELRQVDGEAQRQEAASRLRPPLFLLSLTLTSRNR